MFTLKFRTTCLENSKESLSISIETIFEGCFSSCMQSSNKHEWQTASSQSNLTQFLKISTIWIKAIITNKFLTGCYIESCCIPANISTHPVPLESNWSLLSNLHSSYYVKKYNFTVMIYHRGTQLSPATAKEMSDWTCVSWPAPRRRCLLARWVLRLLPLRPRR